MGLIVCATDFSNQSTAVVSTAAAFSRLFGAPLELFHLFEAPPAFSPDVLDQGVIDDLRRSAEKAIAIEAEELRAVGVDVRTYVQYGPPHDIAHHARSAGASLLVVGTHGRRGAKRLFHGSVAEHAIRETPCPIVVVPATAVGHLAGAHPGGTLKIVVGVDFSPASDAALAWLRGLRERTPCEVHVVHLYVPAREHARLGFEPPEPFETNAEVVDSLARDLRAHVHAQVGTDFALRVRPNWGGEDDPLAWEAETDGADLLVIGTSQARRSTSLTTVRGSHLPVVCVPKAPGTPDLETTGPVHTVLAVTDFSPSGNLAVAQAYRMLSDHGEVVLAHVAMPDDFGLDLSRQEEIESCLLALVPPDVDRRGVRTRTFVAAGAVASEAIIKAIRRFAPDLVVMAGQGGAATGRSDHRTTTDEVLARSPKPVLVVPGPPRGT
ncbi:MAG TPA: universal stress protein [Polyangia bacterium]|nr:universal stress protein [Polyangia bacterium]